MAECLTVAGNCNTETQIETGLLNTSLVGLLVVVVVVLGVVVLLAVVGGVRRLAVVLGGALRVVVLTLF